MSQHLSEMDLAFSAFGIPRMLFKRHAAQSKLPPWSMAMNLCYCSDSAALFRGWGQHTFCQLPAPAFLSAFFSVLLLKAEVASQGELSGSAWIPVQVNGRNLNNPPPLHGLCAACQEDPFPFGICPKQFRGVSRTYPENVRNLSNIFCYIVRPLFIGLSDQKLSVLFSNTFRVTFRTFYCTCRTY